MKDCVWLAQIFLVSVLVGFASCALLSPAVVLVSGQDALEMVRCRRWWPALVSGTPAASVIAAAVALFGGQPVWGVFMLLVVAPVSIGVYWSACALSGLDLWYTTHRRYA